jgi:4-hydroxybenzoate polyprenyltransferase
MIKLLSHPSRIAPHPDPHPARAAEDGSRRWAGDPSDINQGDWVERYLPTRLRPYARLARLDRPIGTWLLLFPGWWGIALASERWPDLVLLLLFAVGAVAMRGAGCTLNDIADRDYDGQVARTRLRPLPSGAVSLAQAAGFLVLQLAIGAAVLFSLNRTSVLLGCAVLGLIGTYPFMKRITYWPQIFLGLAFSWGALMGWPAAFGRLDWPPLVLYAGSICWVIGYDTIYAHQDREDDLLVGIKSTALLFGEKTPTMLASFYIAAVVLISAAGLMAGGGLIFTLGLIAFAAHLAWQVTRLDIDDPAHCLVLFKSNRDAGLILFAAMLLEAAF